MDDLDGLAEWSKIVDTLTCIGIQTIIEDLKKIHDGKKKLEEKRKKKKLPQRKEHQKKLKLLLSMTMIPM
eukprot:4622511-Ditylum_brightwellii.AAC.1